MALVLPVIDPRCRLHGIARSRDDFAAIGPIDPGASATPLARGELLLHGDGHLSVARIPASSTATTAILDVTTAL